MSWALADGEKKGSSRVNLLWRRPPSEKSEPKKSRVHFFHCTFDRAAIIPPLA